MKIVTIHVAKTQLSQLLAEVEAGEEIVLARGKTPIAKLTRYAAPQDRVFGSMKGVLDVGDEILEPLPEEELRAWE
jgi:antitoxin (DNA-binding transcriptional repressor) of toxin-antitoxin stability system